MEAEEVSASKASGPVVNKTKLELPCITIKKQFVNSEGRKEEEKCTRQEKERITREIAEAEFHSLKPKAETTSGLATKIPIGTWKNIEDKVDKL